MTKLQILLSLLLIISTTEAWIPKVLESNEVDANNEDDIILGSGSCSFVSYGTGIASIDYQKNIPNMRYGCCFMSACVKGGLCTTAQISAAYSWALSAGKIRADTYVLVGGEQLAKDISAHYGTTYHSDYYIRSNSRHFWLVNSSGTEIFNSAGLGWH